MILLYIELYKLHWNVYILFIVGVVFAGTLVSSVELSYTGMCVFSLVWVWSLLVNWFLPRTKLHWNVYILFTVHVVIVGRLVCSVNVLYMELS